MIAVAATLIAIGFTAFRRRGVPQGWDPPVPGAPQAA